MTTSTNTVQDDRLLLVLSEHAPVRIKASEWPIIAQAGIPERHDPAEQTTQVIVRHHSDGRAIVYGHDDKQRVGYVLPLTDGNQISNHVKAICTRLQLDRDFEARIINRLPPVDL